MSRSSHWTLFIARPGNHRQHVIRDPHGEPRINFGEDDGTGINDRLASYIVESLNSGLVPEDPSPEEGWFMDCLEEGDENGPAILICDPDFEVKLEILETETAEADKVLGRRVAALINTYFLQSTGSYPSASSLRSKVSRRHTRS